MSIKPSINESQNSRGFTLTELLVTIAIVAILSAISLPLYTQYSQRTYLTELQADLLNCAQGLERSSALNFTYAGTADTDADGIGDADAGPIAANICNPESVRAGRYAIAVAAPGTTFVLTATPDANGPMSDQGDLTIDDAGVRQWDENDDGDFDDADEDDWAKDLP